MGLMTWDEKFSVGVDDFDTDHKILMDLINQLHDTYACGKGADALEPVFETLMEYIERHFAREEVAMARCSYPGLADHHRQHAELRGTVLRMHECYLREEEPALVLDLLEFLFSWWYVHILQEDMAYRPYLGQANVATAAPRQTPAPEPLAFGTSRSSPGAAA